MAIYEVHLGSWARVPDEEHRYLTYARARRAADRVREGDGLHAHRAAAGDGAPVLRILGLSGHRVLRADQPVRIAGGLQGLRRRLPSGRHRRASSTGCRATSRATRTRWRSFDGTALFEHADPRQGEHRDWGTLIFNYGRNEVRNYLLANALFWLHEYHVDGLRVDAVASMLYLDYSRNQGEWIPNQYGGRENLEAIEFLRQLNTLTHAESPGSMTIAEESTAWPSVSRPAYLGGLGFTYKWNMGWMNDILEYMKKNPVYRRYDHQHLTFSLLYAFTENFILPFSHDEVVHGKGSMFGKIPGDDWQKAATLRALYGFMYRPPRQEADVHGGGVRPGPRVEPRSQPRLAPARRAAARRASAASCRI